MKFKSLAAVLAAMLSGVFAILISSSSSAQVYKADVGVCEKVQVALDACNAKLQTCTDDSRSLIEYIEANCGATVTPKASGGFDIKKKPATTTTASIKPTATATATVPPPKPQILCMPSKKLVFTAAQCECGEGEVLVKNEKAPNERVCVGKGKDGANGKDGKDGVSFSIKDNGDGTALLVGTDGTSFLVRSGKDALPGKDGKSVPPCTVKDNGDNTSTVTCPDGTSATLKGGSSDVGWIPPPMVGLEFPFSVWVAASPQGTQFGEGTGVLVHGRLSERSRIVGAFDVQWTSIAPKTGGMLFLWPQIGYRYYLGAYDLYYATSLDFLVGFRQGVSTMYGNQPMIDGRRYVNSQFWGGHATFAVALNTRLSSWLSIGAKGWLGYGWWLTTVDCPPTWDRNVLPSSHGLGGGVDLHATLTF